MTAGSGRFSEVIRTTVLPATSGGARRLTSPSSDEVSGATIPTTPVGSGIVKLKYEAATGLDGTQHLGDLVGPAGVPDPAIDGAVDERAGAVRLEPFGRGHFVDELVAPALHELGDAVQDLAAVHRRSIGPAGERLARGTDGVAQVLARPAAGVRERRPVLRAHEVRAAALRARERAADVQLVGLADLDAGLRRGASAAFWTAREVARPRAEASPFGRGWRLATAIELPWSAVLQAHVGVQAVHPALAPEARLLVATERATSGSNRLNVFAQTTPAFIRVDHLEDPRCPSRSRSPADRPYGVLFAFSIASSGVRKVSTDRTGPKISSWAIRWLWRDVR